MITTAGKKAILEYFAGYTRTLVGSIVVGVGSSAASTTDQALDFEVLRVPITNVTIDYANEKVIFKAQIPANESLSIYEIGAHSLTPQTSAVGGRYVIDFNEDNDLWSSGTWVANNSRMTSGLQLSPTASSTATSYLDGLTMDLSAFSTVDTFTFAFYSSNANTASVTYKFMTDDTNYFSKQFTSIPSAQYVILDAAKGSFSATGSPSWGNITKIQVEAVATSGGTATVIFDGFKVENLTNDREESVLIARSVLGSPITKVVGLPMDIEYGIDL